MPHHRVDPLERLTPPPGGLAMLREKLSGRRRRRVVGRRWTWAAAVLAPAAAALAFLLWTSSRTTPAAPGWPADPHPDFIALGLSPQPDEPVVVSGRARASIAVDPVIVTDRVVYYRIAVLPPQPSPKNEL